MNVLVIIVVEANLERPAESNLLSHHLVLSGAEKIGCRVVASSVVVKLQEHDLDLNSHVHSAIRAKRKRRIHNTITFSGLCISSMRI
jgi:hypothetical protein